MLTAQQIAQQFANGLHKFCGDFGLDVIVAMTGVEEDKLVVWLDATGRLADDGQGAWLDSFAEVWEAFAAESHLCALMYAASLKAPKQEIAESEQPKLRVV